MWRSRTFECQVVTRDESAVVKQALSAPSASRALAGFCFPFLLYPILLHIRCRDT